MLRLFRHYVPSLALAVAVVDVALIAAAVALVDSVEGWIGPGPIWPKSTALAAIFLFTAYVSDLYDIRRPVGHRESIVRLLVAIGVAAILAAAFGYAIPTVQFGRRPFLQTLAIASVGLLVWRVVWVHLSSYVRRRERVLVVGIGPSANTLLGLQSTGASPFTVVGFLDDSPAAHERLPAGADFVGKARDLLNIVEEIQPDLILVALPDMRGTLPAEDLLECRLRGTRVEHWQTFYEKQTGKILVSELRPSALIFSDGFVKTRLTRALKRAFDLVVASAGLIVALPIMAIVAVAIKMDSPGPVFFRQKRVGHNGRPFNLKKFRSMHQDAETESGPVWTTARDPRVTRVGRLLRRTRLDEVPQMLNVLAGEMSFVGPRPERPEFVRTLRRQIPFYMERLSVKPGISGWAQISHQYAASIEDTLEKLEYDLYYVKNLSLFLDLLILLSTIHVVISGRGAR